MVRPRSKMKTSEPRVQSWSLLALSPPGSRSLFPFRIECSDSDECTSTIFSNHDHLFSGQRGQQGGSARLACVREWNYNRPSSMSAKPSNPFIKSFFDIDVLAVQCTSCARVLLVRERGTESVYCDSSWYYVVHFCGEQKRHRNENRWRYCCFVHGFDWMHCHFIVQIVYRLWAMLILQSAVVCPYSPIVRYICSVHVCTWELLSCTICP